MVRAERRRTVSSLLQLECKRARRRYGRADARKHRRAKASLLPCDASTSGETCVAPSAIRAQRSAAMLQAFRSNHR